MDPTYLDDSDALEAIVDRHSLKDVMEMLHDIARAKAEHIRNTWQDPVTARPWDIAARKIARTFFGTSSTRITV